MSLYTYTGDALTVLKSISDRTIRTCVTSPPYFGLRNYNTEGQIGLEHSPEEYCAKLVKVFDEVRRVLTDDGTLWLILGDSYATRSGSQPPTNTKNKFGHTAKTVPKGYKAKDIVGIPWMVAFALRASGWYLRQDIIWQKSNCLPENVKDRCTKSHEYIFLLAKSPHYYFNSAAISEPIARSGPRVNGSIYRRNKRSVWTTATASFRGSHPAVFPESIVTPCVLAGSEPGDIILDPFMGSGTTGVVAVKTNRDFVGIEINPEYMKDAKERIKAAMIEEQRGGTT